MTDQLNTTPLSGKDKHRARRFLGVGGWTDGLFDRNWARRMEQEGWLRLKNSAMHGERLYEPTAALCAEMER